MDNNQGSSPVDGILIPNLIFFLLLHFPLQELEKMQIHLMVH